MVLKRVGTVERERVREVRARLKRLLEGGVGLDGSVCVCRGWR